MAWPAGRAGRFMDAGKRERMPRWTLLSTSPEE